MGAFCRRTFDKAEGGGSRHPVWSALDRNAIALGNGWDQVFAKGAILIVVGLPVPVVAGRAIVHVARPAIDDGVALGPPTPPPPSRPAASPLPLYSPEPRGGGVGPRIEELHRSPLPMRLFH